MDIRQRLTVSRGYGVAELHIPDGSDYVGRTIAESALREKDINILTLHRGTTIMPNPHSSRELQAGDRLLCFGRLEEMRHLVPDRARLARLPKIKKLKKPTCPLRIESCPNTQVTTSPMLKSSRCFPAKLFETSP